jgi:uncharacterized integral membrane protein
VYSSNGTTNSTRTMVSINIPVPDRSTLAPVARDPGEDGRIPRAAISRPEVAMTEPVSSSKQDRPRVRSRIGGLWVTSVLFAVVLLLLLIFVLENGQSADVAFFGVHAHLPMGVALLLAAVFGVLLVALPGSARIMQLRMRQHRQAGKQLPSAAEVPVSQIRDSLDSHHSAS